VGADELVEVTTTLVVGAVRPGPRYRDSCHPDTEPALATWPDRAPDAPCPTVPRAGGAPLCSNGRGTPNIAAPDRATMITRLPRALMVARAPPFSGDMGTAAPARADSGGGLPP
jgi:hypothetical protein